MVDNVLVTPLYPLPVIPDEFAVGERDPESIKFEYSLIATGSRLASAVGGLGRDDELRRSLLRGERGPVVILRS